MKRQISIGLFLLALFCAAPVFAQKTEIEKPDFSGTWNLNVSKSNLGLLGSAFKGKCQSQMVITHKEPVVTIQRMIQCNSDKTDVKPLISNYTSTFFSGARGENNSFENEKYKSQTKWKNRKIFIEEKLLNSKTDKEISSNIIELKLSKDGKILTYTSAYAPTYGTPGR